METARRDPFPGSIRTLFGVGTVAGMSDGQLLDRFLSRREEEAAEVAFAALVERHGPMVLRVCRARLGDDHDAQDAFQATFLILARRAGSIRQHESAACWLHGVARRVASCARRAADLRRAKERSAVRTSEATPDADHVDFAPIVREEVGGLPEKYRTPLVLCLLDGLTHEEAATRLGWPVGTVKTRVRWAKDRLRTRLTRRGLAPSLGAIGTALASIPAEAMPEALVRSTARAAMQSTSGRVATGVISASVAGLVELGRRSLIMSRWKVVALVFASVGALAAGAGGLARQASENQEKGKQAKAQPEVKLVKMEPAPTKMEPAPTPDAIEAERNRRAKIVERLKEVNGHVELFRMTTDLLKDQIKRLSDRTSELEDRRQSFERPKSMTDAEFEMATFKMDRQTRVSDLKRRPIACGVGS